MMVNGMWIAILKQQITKKYSEKRIKKTTENLKNTKTGHTVEFAYDDFGYNVSSPKLTLFRCFLKLTS